MPPEALRRCGIHGCSGRCSVPPDNGSIPGAAADHNLPKRSAALQRSARWSPALPPRFLFVVIVYQLNKLSFRRLFPYFLLLFYKVSGKDSTEKLCRKVSQTGTLLPWSAPADRLCRCTADACVIRIPLLRPKSKRQNVLSLRFPRGEAAAVRGGSFWKRP